MQEKRGILGGEKNNMVKSQPKKGLKIKGCLLHNSDLWKTPTKIYNHFIKNEYFDPCPTNPKFNGLSIEWKNKNFVNPPYSKISEWINKAIIELQKNKESIFLIPARTDTKWFRKIIENKGRIIFIQGRLHFSDKKPAPFPSMFVIFTPYWFKEFKTFSYMKKEELENYFK